MLENGAESIPPTNVQTLKDDGIAGFQPHVEFRDSEGGRVDRLDPGDFFYVGNLAVGWQYAIELIWAAGGATVARAEFIELG